MSKFKNIVITPKMLEELKRTALIESVGSSMRLSGSKITNEEVEQLLLKFKKRRLDIEEK